MQVIPASFYTQPTHMVARALIGKKLIRVYNGSIISGIITETEAYGGSDDPASHAYRKMTPRNTPMFGDVGHAYVYFTYGVHHCLNIVARDEHAQAGAVLIRSIEPVDGIELIKHFRNTTCISNVTNGPGKLCQALQVHRKHTGIDMTKEGELFVCEDSFDDESDIIVTPRIGISTGKDLLWRFKKK